MSKENLKLNLPSYDSIFTTQEKCVTWSLIRWKKCDEFDLFAGKSVKL